MKQTEKSSYRNIVKSTAIFGGVQVFTILVTLVRGKFIALFLGPSGMGIYSLLLSTANTIQQFSGLGLNLSATKEISQAYEKQNTESLNRVVFIFRRLLRLTGILGCVISVAFAPYWSRFAFGSAAYGRSFVLLALMLYFTTLSNGEDAILQGTRRLKKLALATLAGSSAGLIAGIPLYYYFGVKGIVPSLIVVAFFSYIVKLYFTRETGGKVPRMGWWQICRRSKGMVALGVVSMAGALLGNVTVYLLNTFVSRWGTLSDVGMFQAAVSITNQYVGIVFTAMAVDYFPRLAAVSSDNAKVREAVNNQSEIVLLAAAPLIVCLIVTAPLLIRLLLTPDFLPVVSLVRWMVAGVFFRAASFPLGYISFSKGDKRFFFWLDAVGGNAVTLALSTAGYYYGGLAGLGMAFSFSYGLYYAVIILATRIRYSFRYDDKVIRLIVPLFGLCLLSFLLTYIRFPVLYYALQTVVAVATGVYAYKELDKRIGLAQLIREKFGKR